MKKIFGIALVLAVLAVLAFGSVALADSPTEVTIDWGDGSVTAPGSGWSGGYGSGWIGGNVQAGDDAIATFYCGGSDIKGTFSAKCTENTAYPYMGVDNFQTYMKAEVQTSSPGFIELTIDRTDSYGSYGPPGQQSYSSVYVEDGWGALSTGGNTNYARSRDCCMYSNLTPNGYNLEANAGSYEIVRQFTANNGDLAYIYGLGSGSAGLDCANSEAWNTGSNHLRLGFGCGCYTDADYNATGVGGLELYGQGQNSVAFNDITTTGSTGGGGTYNGSLNPYVGYDGGPGLIVTGTNAWFDAIWTFNSSFTMPNTSIDVR
jgi:hypothetical protein